MSTLKTFNQGESVSIGFALPVDYELQRIEDIKVYIGSKLFENTITDNVVRCELRSDQTKYLTGQNKIYFWIDDSILGVKEHFCGYITFVSTPAVASNESLNLGFDILINLLINEETIAVDSILYDLMKGADGDDGVGISSIELLSKVDFVATYRINLTNETFYDYTVTDGQNGADPYARAVLAGYEFSEEQFYIDLAQVSTKVDKVAGSSLVPDTEIAKLADYPEFPVTSSGYYLSDSGEWKEIAIAGGGQAVNTYPTNINSPVSGYKVSSAINDAVESVKTITATQNNVIAWGEKYLYNAQVSADVIQSGFWQVHLFGSINNIGGLSRAVCRIFKYSAIGVETEIVAPFYSREINDTLENSSIEFLYASAAINILPTDTIGHQFGFITDAINPTKIFTYKVGDGYASHINTPLAMRHNQLRDLNGDPDFQHVNQAEKDKIAASLTSILTDENTISGDGKTTPLSAIFPIASEELYSDNLYDFETAKLTNGYIGNSSGAIFSASAGTYHPSPFIQWREFTQLTICYNGSIASTGSYSALQYDSNYAPIAASWTGTSANLKSITKYTGAIYIRITLREGQQNQINYGSSALQYDTFFLKKIFRKDNIGGEVVFKPFLDDEDLVNEYVKDAKAIKMHDGIVGLWMNKNIKHVNNPSIAIDNISNFSHIIDAVASITDASATNPYEVWLHTDINVTDSTGFKAFGYDPFKAVAHVKNFITLRGIGSLKTIHAELPDNTPLNPADYETMHFDGGGNLENIRVTGRNVRYAVHYERAVGIPGLNQNTASKIINSEIEHLGCYSGLAIPWTATDAFGGGTGQGLTIEFINSIVRGDRHGIRIHNSPAMLYPNRFLFKNSYVSGNPNAFNLDDYASNMQNTFEFINTNVDGILMFTQTSSTYTSKTCIPIPKICGGNNSLINYNFAAITPVGLRITSSTTGVTSSVSIVTDIDLFGKVFKRLGNIGVAAWINGDECVTAANYNLTNRLGNCLTVPKTLVLNIDGVERSIIFNQNYLSGYTNTTILTYINAQLSGIAVASLNHPIRYYYPEFSNVLFAKKYTGSSYILKGTFVKFTGLGGFRELIAGEKPDGYLLDDVSVGETARIVNNLITLNSGNFAPLFYSTNVFVEGNKFNIQDGKLIIDANTPFDIIAISSTYIKINI